MVLVPVRPTRDRPAGALRAGASKAELMSMIVSGWTKRSDRGAEERNELRLRDALVSVEELRQDPHLEMHTRGG